MPRARVFVQTSDALCLSACLAVLTLARPAAALPPAVCPGDTNGDLVVNFSDLSATLAQWGTAGPVGDANNDGAVNFLDASVTLANWGATCPVPRIEAPGTASWPPAHFSIDPYGPDNYWPDPDFRCYGRVFAGGIITDDVGTLAPSVSAAELNFQTDGPIICQALFQRLAPRAPRYGAQINYAGDRLEIYFDPAYTVTPAPIFSDAGGMGGGCFFWPIDPIRPLDFSLSDFPPGGSMDTLRKHHGTGGDWDSILPVLPKLDFVLPLTSAPNQFLVLAPPVLVPPTDSPWMMLDSRLTYFTGLYSPPPATDRFVLGFSDGFDIQPDSWPLDPVLPFSPLAGLCGHSGEVVLCAVDLAVPGRGPDLVWARTYRSRLSPEGARLGHGWDHSYNIFVEPIGPDLVLHDGGGRADRYSRQPDGSWTCPEFFRVITRNPDQTHTVTFAHGTKWNLRALDGSPAAGRIASLVDRNNNTITFTYDVQGRLVSIQDTLHNPPNSPRALTIAYNADGRISSVTDWTGRQVVYQYYGAGDPGGSPGDLKSVRSPVVVSNADFPIPPGHDFPAGLTTVYTYSRGFADDRLNHNLLSVVLPGGQAPVSLAYSPATNASDLHFDRCVRVSAGQVSPGGDNLDLHWTIVAPDAPVGTVRMVCTINDPLGNVRELSFDRLNRLLKVEEFPGRAPDPDSPTTLTTNRPINPLRPTDPASYATSIEYNADSLITRLVRPELDEVLIAYDSGSPLRRSQGNLVSITRLPGPRPADQASITAAFTHEPAFNFVLSATDPRGNTTQHQYDARGNCVRTIHRIPSIVVDREYNSFGQLTAVVWPDNGSAHRRRDEFLYYSTVHGHQNGYLRRAIADATALALLRSFEYDRVGNLVRQTDPAGMDSLRTVDQLNRTVLLRSREVALPAGPTRYAREFFRDLSGNVIRVETDNINAQGLPDFPARLTFNVIYDAHFRPVRFERERDAGLFVATECDYDANGMLSRVRFAEAVNGNDPFNTWSCRYDERGLPLDVIEAEGSPIQCTARYDYNGNGGTVRIARGTETAARVASIDHDGYDRVRVFTDAMGNQWILQWDANSNCVTYRRLGELNDIPGTVNNATLDEVLSQFDAMNRLVFVERDLFDLEFGPLPGAWFRQLSYNDLGEVLQATDSFGRVTAHAYDTMGRLAGTTDPRGNVVNYTYDPRSNIARIVRTDLSDLGNPPQVLTSDFTWDTLDRCTSATDNAGQQTRYAYDSRGNLVELIDPRGNRTEYVYDGLSRLVRQERILTTTGDGNGVEIDRAIVAREYDDSSRLRASTDPNGNTTRYAHDSRDRRIVTLSADGTLNQVGTGAVWPLGNPNPNLAAFTTGYNRFGDPVVVVDARGNRIDSTYDGLSRCIARAITLGPGVVGTTFENYQYDGLSRLVRAQDNDSVVTLAYDSLDNLRRETQQVAANPVRTILHDYNVESEHLSTTYPGGRIINRLFDALGRVINLSDNVFDPIASYQYLGPARIERRQCANDTDMRLLYDPAERPVGVHHQRISTGQPIVHLNYAYDPAGNRILADEPSAQPPPYSKHYAYDSFNRLVSSQVFDGPNPPRFSQYQYDSAGNRRFVNGDVDPGPYILDPTMPVPADAQMNQYTQTPFDQRLYDDSGNLTRAQAGPTIRSFAYDYRGQLAQFTSGAINATYSYDALGRRIQKTGAGVTTARYYYHGARLIEEQNSANATVSIWVHGPDGPVQYIRGATRRYLHADDLGSIRVVTDQAGTVVERCRYDDFGKASFFNAAGNPIANTQVFNPFSFHGRFYDAESSLLQNAGRYLDPRAGRLIGGDEVPIEILSMTLTGGYAGNNAVSCRDASDPPGICGTPWTWPGPDGPPRRWNAVSDGWRDPWWRSPMIVAAEWIEMGWHWKMHWDEVRKRIRELRFDDNPDWHKDILESLEREIDERERIQREILRQST